MVRMFMLHRSTSKAEPHQLIRDTIAHAAPFNAWDRTQQDALARCARLANYRKQRILRSAEGPFHQMFVVVDGCLEVSRDNAKGEVFVLQLAGAGEVVGLLMLLPEPRSDYNVIARSDSRVIHIPVNSLRRLLDDHPLLWRSIALHSMEVHRKELKAIGQHILDALGLQIASALVRVVASAPSLSADGKGICLAINQADLGSMLGLSRQTINRGLKDLTDQGVIGVGYKTIKIRDLDELRRIARVEA